MTTTDGASLTPSFLSLKWTALPEEETQFVFYILLSKASSKGSGEVAGGLKGEERNGKRTQFKLRWGCHRNYPGQLKRQYLF